MFAGTFNQCVYSPPLQKSFIFTYFIYLYLDIFDLNPIEILPHFQDPREQQHRLCSGGNQTALLPYRFKSAAVLAAYLKKKTDIMLNWNLT